MIQTTSASEGCFVFKSKRHKQGNRKVQSSFLNNNDREKLWYKSFQTTWNKIENEINGIQDEDMSSMLTELIKFVDEDNNVSHSLLPTAILLTGINQNDHYSQFQNLSKKMKENINTDIVTLQSRDCMNLKSAFQKLVSNFIEQSSINDTIQQKCLRRSEYTLKILEAWFLKLNAGAEKNKKLIIILPDFELFNVDVFKKIIIVLCSYRLKLPLIVIIGVATSLSALRNALPYRVLNKTNLKVFRNEPSANNLNKIVENVLLSPFCPFHLSGDALQFLIDIFLFYDFSVNSFVQALKYCSIQHFSLGNIFALCTSENVKDIVDQFEEEELTQIRRLPSCRRFLNNESSANIIGFFLSNEFLKQYILKFINMVNIYWFNFYCGLHVFRIMLEDLPETNLRKTLRHIYLFCSTKNTSTSAEYKKVISLLQLLSKDEFLDKLKKILPILIFFRNQSTNANIILTYTELINKLEKFYNTILSADLNTNSNTDITTNKSDIVKLEQASNRQEFKDMMLEMSTKKKVKNEITVLIENCLTFIETEIIEKYLIPVSKGPPLIELYVFNDIASIKRYVVGTPRGAVHTALNNPNHYLMCSCCILTETSSIIPALPDISIAYKLYSESGKLINLFDWLQSFRCITDSTEDETYVDPKIQARFTRAVSELEHLGFIKTTKKKTDHVTKLTW